MPLGKRNNAEIRFSENVVEYLNSLIDLLFEQDYFAYKESAMEYITNMRIYIEENFSVISKYPAPPYFAKYFEGLYYVIYQPNKHTTWYFFYIQEGNRYLICYVTNNHFEGQYIR